MGLGALLGMLGAAAGSAAENPPVPPVQPPAALVQVIRSLGPPGLVWGRLVVEEESPAGPWTPLNGVEVRLYPAVPGFLDAGLEKIRETARNSGNDFDQAVTRVQATLAAYQTLVVAAAREIGAGTGSTGGQAPRQVTDSEGLFVFPEVPSGDWLLVAIRVTPYARATPGSGRERRIPSHNQGGTQQIFPGNQRFLPGARPPAKDAEVWLKPVHVGAGERVALTLTDRARWLVGPIR